MASENERSSSTNNSHHQQQLQQQHYQQPLHLTLFEAGVASRRESLNLLRSNRIRINDVPIRDLARTDVQLRNFTVDFLNSLISSGMLSPGNFSSCSKANPCSETNNAITSFRDVTITMVDNDDNNNNDKNKTSQTLQIIDTTPQTHRYLLLHKPRGILCSCSPENRSWATSSKKRKQTSSQPPRSHCDNDRENDNVRNDRSSSNDYVSPPLITSLVPPHIKERLGYVGRLDLDSEGLVFMTNDHSLMDGLLIPRKVDDGGVGADGVDDRGGGGGGCGKVYEIVVLGRPEEKDVEELRKGKKIGNMGKLLPCRIEFLDWFESIRRGSGSPGDNGIENDGVSGEQGDGVGMLHRPYDDNFDNIAEDIRGYSKFRVTLWEGKKNQIRRMFGSIGHRVIRLVRVSFGPLRLGTLPVGGWRYLTEEEITKLKRCCDGKLSLETGESKT